MHAVYTLLDMLAMLLLTPLDARHTRRVEDTYLGQYMMDEDAYTAEMARVHASCSGASPRASDAKDDDVLLSSSRRRGARRTDGAAACGAGGESDVMHAIPFSLHDLSAMTAASALASTRDEDTCRDAPHPSPPSTASFSAAHRTHRDTVASHAVMGRLARGAAAVLMCLMRGRTLALVKSWLDTLERKLQQLMYDFVARNMAPVLIRRSLESVWAHSPDAQGSTTALGEPARTLGGVAGVRQFQVSEYMTVQLSAVQRCVLLTYEKEDMKLSMRMTFPAAYPLRPVSIEPVSDRKSSGVSVEQRRLWVLKMSVRLFSGSTDVWGCVELLRRNLDAHFEGIEPCPICYLVVSTTDQKLPSMTCSACHNTPFHASCLYRWWSNGGKTECPLCRAPWIAD